MDFTFEFHSLRAADEDQREAVPGIVQVFVAEIERSRLHGGTEEDR